MLVAARALSSSLAFLVAVTLAACSASIEAESASATEPATPVDEGEAADVTPAPAHDAGTSAAADASHAPTPSAHWTYEGEEGPEHWGDLAPSYATCKTGGEQSPIDIPASVASAELAGIALSYAPAPVAIVDNGHTVQVNFVGGSNAITIAGKEYKLLQYHFHKHSEHTLGGAPLPLEVHLVHKASDGRLAVLGAFYSVGAVNEALQGVFDAMHSATATATSLPFTFDPSVLLPSDRAGWTYDGSLTTPPCSEGVKWNVFAAVQEVSEDQLAAFHHDPSARPVQPLGARTLHGGN